MTRWVRLGAAMTLCSGCMHTAYTTGAPRQGPEPTVEGTSHFFIAGLAPSQSINAASICAERGVSRVETKKSFLDGFLAILTASIYTPRSYRVWCAATPPATEGDTAPAAAGVGEVQP